MPHEFGVLFDMDGVLVDSNPVHKKAIQLFCDKYGKSVPESFLQKHIYGRTNKEWIPVLFKHASEKEIKTLEDEKEALFRQIFSPRNAVITGLFSFLDKLQKHQIPMVLATSAPAENADYILSELKLSHYFQAVLNSSHVKVGKPDPDIYLKAAQSIECHTNKCVVIEDSFAGIISGKEAGAAVVGITSTHSADELSACDLVVDSFDDLSLQKLKALLPV